MKEKIIRVSIGNLAWYVSLDNSKYETFGVLNSKKPNQVKALGGGAMLTEEGKKTIERSFGAYDFEQDKGTGFYDARFKTYEKHLEEVFRLFFGDTKGMEKDRTLDIREELTKKEFGDRPLLSEEDAQQVSFRQMMTVRQAPATQDDTSARASHDVETRRLFRIFCINMPNCAMYDDFFLSKSVVRLSGPERRTTRHGACAGITKDGLLIQNNLFIP